MTSEHMLPEWANIEMPRADFPVLKIKHASCEACIALQGAHLMHWQPIHQEPVIYTSPRTMLELGKAIRGGVPICWPWFGAAQQPAHGFARISTWNLVDVIDRHGFVDVTLELKSCAKSLQIWPHAFSLQLTISLGHQLHLSLTCHNTDELPFEVTSALHSYFHVNSIHDVVISGLENTQYEDLLTEVEALQINEITFKEELDRIYHSSADVTIEDSSRKILIQSDSSQRVIWNPWTEKATSMKDLGADQFTRFLCVEAAITKKNAILLQPGATFTYEMNVSIV